MGQELSEMVGSTGTTQDTTLIQPMRPTESEGELCPGPPPPSPRSVALPRKPHIQAQVCAPPRSEEAAGNLETIVESPEETTSHAENTSQAGHPSN